VVHGHLRRDGGVLHDAPRTSRRTIPVIGRLTDPCLRDRSQIITRTLLDYKGTGDALAKSPYFASIIVASMIWVGQAWLTRLVYHTPGYAFTNLAFCISFGLSAYNFARAVTLDPGIAPKPRNDAELKEVSARAGHPSRSVSILG
jgi:hypothetical protein